MGFKINDILVSDHSPKKTLKYFYDGDFKELLKQPIKNFQWKEKIFPMARNLGIDKHEICTWETEDDYKNQLILENNKNQPWLRIDCRSSGIDESNLTKKIMEINPEAHVSNFVYTSTSDSAYIFIYKGEDSAFITWNVEEGEIQWQGYKPDDRLKKVPITKNLQLNGEMIIAYYWNHLYPAIPLRFDLTMPTQSLLKILTNISI